MRILYFTQYFPPEVGATQTRAFEMSRYLGSQGHHVTVITEVPNHPSGIIPPEYRGRLSERRTEQGVDVFRLWVWTSPEKTFATRMRFYLSYMGMAALAGSLVRGRYDLVYATSPPLFVGASGLLASLLRRVPLVFEVRDLWPESAVALGELSNRKAIAAAEVLEKALYARASRIVTVTQGIRARLIERGIAAEKLALIPNGANTELFRPDPDGAARLRRELGLESSFVVLYAGIHGIAQGLENVLEAARLLRDEPHIQFVMLGEGPRKAALAQQCEELGLTNLRMLPEVPATSMPAYLSMADCAIVPLKDEPVFSGALPSKMFEAMSCGTPVVLSVAGEAVDVLKEAGGGIAVPPEDPQELARAIEELCRQPEKAREMGGKGQQYVTLNYTRQEQARKLEVLLHEVKRDAR
ncbi:MAG: glycosyltransferase family 4 protein [Chloroflexota bacterium]|nr:glycosyltransferase family 4 protein [Chloroflexota bacterium]MDQ5867487.1 glycosyltransferase family 4 protein [Chloroflexota bacterium]